MNGVRKYALMRHDYVAAAMIMGRLSARVLFKVHLEEVQLHQIGSQVLSELVLYKSAKVQLYRWL